MRCEEKLIRMLKYVSEHNEFYRNRIKEYGIINPLDISQWPTLSRKELQENRYSMFSEGYKSRFFNQQLRRQFSSGSTGIPVNIYWENNDWYISNMALWRKRNCLYGISPKDKCVKFTHAAIYRNNDEGNVQFDYNSSNTLSINVSLIHNSNGWEKVVNLINEFKPTWLEVQPFVLNKLIQAYQECGLFIPSGLEYIETLGELLTEDLRKRANDYFGVPIIDMYGSEEMNGIAIECPYHNLHILDENVLVEVKNDNMICGFGEGEAIITNLNNYAMPLIRYQQGDRIAIRNNSEMCLCGCTAPIISNIIGRIGEGIYIDETLEITPFMLSEIISEVNNQFKDIITMYGYVYDSSHSTLRCNIHVPEKSLGWYDNVKKALEITFKQKMQVESRIAFEVYYIPSDCQCIKKNRILEIV